MKHSFLGRGAGMLGGLAAGGAMLLGSAGWSTAARITMKDGRTIDGGIAQLSSMAENLNAKNAEGVESRPIVFADDNLRRTFVPKRLILNADQGMLGEPEEKLIFRQPVPREGARLGIVGPLVEVTPYDDFGRRTVKMITNQGVLPIIQGITELTPHWTKLESLQMEGRILRWDMRVSTASIPLIDLERVFAKVTDPKSLEQRLRIVRFYLQAERYKEAEQKLKAVIADFPENQEFGRTVLKLHQGYARQILRQVQTRRDAAQHQLAYAMLKQFPSEDVAGETLQAVRKMLDDYNVQIDQVRLVLEHFDADLKRLSQSPFNEILAKIREELRAELNLNTLARMSAYKQFWEDEGLPVEDKVALAVSGWLVGTNDATRKLPQAISLWHTRALVLRYLTESGKLKLEDVLAQFKLQEASTPALVARLLAHMKPPLPPGEAVKDAPGLYQHDVEIAADEPRGYFVQLPPEYDPHRLYPTVVTLHAAGTTPAQQIDWWSGVQVAGGSRLGHATQNGYIVIAPAWSKPQQRSYNYSTEEHAAVLYALRDAGRRYSIDTDKVFLSGHAMGGDAAWDIALSHPDLWAGVIPITAVADRYVARYWENAEYVPFYLVTGQMDADYAVRNSRDLDRYFKHAYNCTVVEFQGRGHEHFYDEIPRLFDWMSRCKRSFFPKEFTTHTMRDFDSFFWWVEMSDLPPRSTVNPENWPPPANTLPVETKASLNEKNGLYVRTGAASVTVWLSPELVDFKQPIRVTVNGQRLKAGPNIDPDLAVLLDDARSRGDRQHVFWARVDMPGGRVNVAAK